MSTNHTPNYALSLWEASDQVQRTEFNENHAKIDAVLAAIQAALSDKADSAALAALSEQVSGKAEQSALASVLERLSALESRTPKIAYGTYAGNGSHGASSPTTLDFSATLGRAPKLLIVRGDGGLGMVAVYGQTCASCGLEPASSGTHNLTVSWSGTRVSWYSSVSSGEYYQMNQTGYTYRYFAIG